MKKILLFIIGITSIFFFIFLFFFSSADIYASTLVNEEASPIREGNNITGMDYVITIGKKVKKDNVYISTSILSSINHYKDVRNIDIFNVDLKINNQSNYSYFIKSISIIDGNITKNIEFKNSKDGNYVFFNLSKNDLLECGVNSYIQIKLEK